MEKHFVTPILESPVTWLVARILGTFMYWYGGLGFLFHFNGAVATMSAEGFAGSPVIVAILTIAVDLIGTALILHGRYVWLGAGMLATFTILTIPLVHDFWNMTGGEAVRARLESEEHLTVIGLLIGISIYGHFRKQYQVARAQPVTV